MLRNKKTIALPPHRIFRVGGSVRDELLGLPIRDEDYVVIGSSVAEMLAAGFRPVGRDFPVFLHPKTHAEYALARTERQQGKGYHGFVFHTAPDVTLSDDLMRRDLTINAMARSSTGELFDPYQGQADLKAKILRHVSVAFAEDPVRILRVARFSARFQDFRIADETLALMKKMVSAGDINHLVAERVWQEVRQGLLEAKPSRLFDTLRECGAEAPLFPEFNALFYLPSPLESPVKKTRGDFVLAALDKAADLGLPLSARCAIFLYQMGEAEKSAALITAFCGRYRLPSDCRDMALLMATWHEKIAHVENLSADALLNLLQKTDALRRPARFKILLEALACVYKTRPLARLQTALAALLTLDSGAIAESCVNKKTIPEAIAAAQKAILNDLLRATPEGDHQRA